VGRRLPAHRPLRLMFEALALLGAGVVVGASAMEVFRSRRLVSRLRDVALCCHELRSALTAIDLGLSRVERSSGPADRPSVEALRHGYDRALCVARDLEAARGALPARSVQRPELVDLREVADRVVRGWNASLPEGARPVALDWHAGTAIVQGYAMRLTQALDNLVANAIEHGRGPVTVVGRMAGSCVSVCVLDRGAGLMRPIDDLRPRSWQARRGHGLVVARHAVELHGGSLRPVRGPFGSGIEVRLPAGAGPTPVRTSGRPGVPRRSGSGAAAP
jgi:signal transduction histidine kinase